MLGVFMRGRREARKIWRKPGKANLIIFLADCGNLALSGA